MVSANLVASVSMSDHNCSAGMLYYSRNSDEGMAIHATWRWQGKFWVVKLFIVFGGTPCAVDGSP